MTFSREQENQILRNLLVQTAAAYDEQLEASHREQELAQVTLEAIADGVITTDAEGRVQYMNPSAARLTGHEDGSAKGLPLESIVQLVDDVTGESRPMPIERCLELGRWLEPTRNLSLVRQDGRRLAISATAAPIRDREGTVRGAIFVFRDVSERQLLLLQLAHQTRHDALTGLPNRQAFEERLGEALSLTKTRDGAYALCYLDLDQFKLINDTCGHAAGDQLLSQVALMLQELVEPVDVLARLGGDEFGLLFAAGSNETAVEKAERLLEAFGEFRFQWNDTRYRVGASLGLVPMEGGFATVADLLSAADHACYLAKEKGRNRVQIFEPDDADLKRRHGEMRWVVRIQESLQDDRFALVAQPIRPLGREDGKLRFEILLRMVGEGGRLLTPRNFLRAAERYDLMLEIDRWVVKRVLATLDDLPEEISGAVELCSVNLSASSVGDPGFLSFLRRALGERGVDRRRLCFEITETAAVSNMKQAIRLIEEVKSAGCSFALDDFGSGMSSYGSLRDLPVDLLKIDGAFVQDMVSDPLDRAMVQSINRIAHMMGIRTVAEWVSSAEAVTRLRELGVDFAQGHYVGRPQDLLGMCRSHLESLATADPKAAG